MANPLKQSYVRMYPGRDQGSSLSIAGFTLDAKDEGGVEVPLNLVSQVEAHGWTKTPPAAQSKKAK